jgi:hypothetical protein
MKERTMTKYSRLFLYVSLLCFVFSLASGALAKNGRDFAGYYAISNVHDLGDPQDNSAPTDKSALVEMTLTVEILNYSDLGDLKDPVLELLPSELSPHVEGGFKTVKLLPGRRPVVVSGEFAVSRAAYQSWGRHGAGPDVVVLYRDESGQTLTQKVQLVPRPMPPPAKADETVR